MIPLTKLTAEAYQSTAPIPTIGAEEVAFIEQAATASERHRSRILLHRDANERLHSMIVSYPRGVYIRPNRHHGKDESVTVLKGECHVLFFHDVDHITKTVSLAAPEKGKAFYCRLPRDVWHTVVMYTDTVLLESTPGPFDPADTEYAPWAQEEANQDMTRAWTDAVLDNPRVTELEISRNPLGVRAESEGVLVCAEDVAHFGVAEVSLLKSLLRSGTKDRVRICAHKSPEDACHEMLMAFSETAHIRISRHAQDETLLVLSGIGVYRFFDDEGKITNQVRIGPLHMQARPALIRIPRGVWHQLYPETDMVVLEATTGPFRKSDTEYPAWESGVPS